ncbi:hypothetical protein NPIL_408361 [Nephila pilipes]|uniref:Uncharacterized protein n=1 Tax=Nephila pilipes TaxID=299642 RepID=A0A8X6NYW8_NEPPI|nr:hypothetical protein NPIL_408361 [Nephila pilipes]
MRRIDEVRARNWWEENNFFAAKTILKRGENIKVKIVTGPLKVLENSEDSEVLKMCDVDQKSVAISFSSEEALVLNTSRNVSTVLYFKKCHFGKSFEIKAQQSQEEMLS